MKKVTYVQGVKESKTMEKQTMRAKMRVEKITVFEHSEVLEFHCVGKSGSYPENGLDEDNSFAKFSPSGQLSITVQNPALRGKFRPGMKFYLDFTETQ